MKPLLPILMLCAALHALPSTARADDWATRAERTDYRETSTYAETVAYCERLDRASPWAKYATFGTSPEGRPLPLLILSRDGAFTPDAARATGKPILLVQNGIHAGEIDGKEASLALAREIVVTKRLASLLDAAIVLVIPIYNVDGHERASPYNRINQDGPENMGWRATGEGLNLNRDYMKADARETRAFLDLFNAWSPHLFVDTHVTNGADYQYDLLYTLESSGYVDPYVARYVDEVFEPVVRPALERSGHVVESYFNLRDPVDITKGIERMIFPPRFSNGYGALRNRPTILVETHMLKPFKTRVVATYDLLVETLRAINAAPKALVDAVEAADRATARLGTEGGEVPLKLAIADSPRPLQFRGVELRFEQSDVSGAKMVVYGDAPKTFEIPLYDRFEVATKIKAPRYYLLPPGWTAVEERLAAHGIAFSRLAEPVTAEIESYRFENVSWLPFSYEGRHPAKVTSVPIRERRTYAAGSIVVPLDQPRAKIAIHLLEPDAPDSLVAWGLFDTIFEQKEYGESYVLEKLAREMMAKDAALKKEFEERLAKDAEFAANPRARLYFFYRRSPYWDAKLNVYPVARVVDPIKLAFANGNAPAKR